MSGKKHNSKAKLTGSVVSVAIVAVILAALYVITSNMRLRADLTEEKLYTLSDGTRNILKDLDRDITLKVFFNKSEEDIPIYFKEFAKRIEDLLKEYKLASNGHLKIEKYDPKPDSDEEEMAEGYGIIGQPMGLTGPTLFLGLAAVAGDSEASIPMFDPRKEDLAEYDITRLIYRVTNPAKPKVGVMSTLPVLGGAQPTFMMPQGQMRQRPWVTFQELRFDSDLIEIPLDAKEIDSSIKTLILMHPKGLSEETLLAIDQFLLAGGKLLVILDPLSINEMETSPAMGMGQPPEPSELDELLSAWNVKCDTTKVTVDMAAATRINVSPTKVQENPMWLMLRAPNISKDDILTAGLDNFMMPFAAAISATNTADLTVTPLITTSEDSAEVSSMAAQMGPAMLKDQYKKGGVPLNLAVRISGKFTTAFPEGIVVTETDSSPGAEDGKEAEPKPERIMPELKEGRSTVVIIGDTDIFADRFCVRAMPAFFGNQAYSSINDNLNFLVNTVEQLSGSPDLIGIRSRGKKDRPFTVVLDMEKEARKKLQAQIETLEKKREETTQRLQELQAQKSPDQMLILSPAQKEAIDNARAEDLAIRKKLKEVRKNFREDIDRLGVILKVVNIGVMPLLIGLIGIAYGLMRKSAR